MDMEFYELMPRLFERGARGSHGVPGHGIGLHVVRRVMVLHGGSRDVTVKLLQDWGGVDVT